MNWITGSLKSSEVKKWIAALSDPARRDSAARELIALGADSVPPLLAALTPPSALTPLYQQILARIPAASPDLIRLLQNGHPQARGIAAEIFSVSKDRAAIPALLQALKGEFFTVRSRAASALANMGDPRAIPYLLPLLKDTEAEVRVAACLSVAQFSDTATFGDIALVLLEDPKIEARQAAARALGRTQNSAALPYLMDALRDSFWWFERENQVDDLLQAIQQMGVSAFDPLLVALLDKESNVRKFAALLLGRLGDIRAIEELGVAVYDLHDEVAKAAADALARFGSPAVDLLAEALRHPEADIRENAVCALRQMQDARVPDLLVEMLRDPVRDVRRQSLLALGELRDSRTWAALQEISLDRADRELAAMAKSILDTMKK